VKRSFTSFLAMTVMISCSVLPARAQLTVFDPANYAQAQIAHAEQVNQTLKMIAQLQRELQQIQQLAQQVAYMKQSLQSLPQDVWNRARNDLSELDQLVAKEGDLMGQASQYDQIFGQIYPGYSPQSGLNSTYLQLDKNTQTAAHALQSAIDASISKVQAGSFQQQAADNRNMIDAANKAQSQIAAVTAGNNLASQSLEQLQKLQALDTLRSQLELNYYVEALAAQKLQTKHIERQDRLDGAMLKWLGIACPQDLCPRPAASPKP